jgi:hypothetical protein
MKPPAIGAHVRLFLIGAAYPVTGYVKDVDRENIVIAKNKNQVGELFHLSSVWSWRKVKEPTK